MNIGIYGGTFDPPHLGHMTSARLAVEALGLDKLLLIPAGIPPHKATGQGASPTQRLELVELAVDSLLMKDRLEVDDLELRREGKSYTADTILELHARYPDDTLWLLMGTDMLTSFHSWYHPEVICAHANLAAFAREADGDREELAAAAERLRRDLGATVEILVLPQVVEISSTQIRALLAQGGGREFLPEPVYGYILRHGLYDTRADLKHLSADDLRACSLSMVYAKRHAHIRGVEEEAVKLARRWGADETDARRAGILHDCTKYLTAQEHFDLCARYGAEVEPEERENDKLLHAKTGALVAREVYGENEAVCRAIRWHTTARADMTLLEKILYMADYMEPNRDLEGVDELRRLAYSDLDAGVIRGLEMTIEDLHQRGKVVYDITQRALDWLIEQRKGH